MPLAVAVPCAALVSTATVFAVPPPSDSVMALLVELAATVAETSAAVGVGWEATVNVTVTTSTPVDKEQITSTQGTFIVTV
ncbi:hypothetical protein D3C72_2333400 [compost metagenome]